MWKKDAKDLFAFYGSCFVLGVVSLISSLILGFSCQQGWHVSISIQNLMTNCSIFFSEWVLMFWILVWFSVLSLLDNRSFFSKFSRSASFCTPMYMHLRSSVCVWNVYTHMLRNHCLYLSYINQGFFFHIWQNLLSCLSLLYQLPHTTCLLYTCALRSYTLERIVFIGQDVLDYLFYNTIECLKLDM